MRTGLVRRRNASQPAGPGGPPDGGIRHLGYFRMAIGIQSIATNDAEALDVLEKVVGFQLILGAELPRLSPADKIKIWRKIAEFAKLIAHSLQWPTAAIIWGPTEPCYAQHASALF